MTRRLFGAALLALLALSIVVILSPTAAFAVEDTGGEEPAVEGGQPEGLPDIGQIGTDVARSEGYFPEEYTSPSWFQWVLYPTIVIGVVMAVGLLLYYLFRQPSFAAEREKSRR